MYGLQLRLRIRKKDIKKFKVMKKTFEKSIYAKRDIDLNEKITLDNISFLKPLSKIHSSDYKKILNKKVNKKVKEGQPLDWKHFK